MKFLKNTGSDIEPISEQDLYEDLEKEYGAVTPGLFNLVMDGWLITSQAIYEVDNGQIF